MRHNETLAIQVFEHERLMVGEARSGMVFTEKHWLALQAYQLQHANAFYTIIHRGVRFNSFVGMMVLPGLVIEVLPKADAHETTPGVWRNWLVHMLLECRMITPHIATPAGTQLRSDSLLDLWIRQFLEATETLLQQGLQKRYVSSESSQTALRGRILFSKNIRKGIIHKEKLYTRHQAYHNQHLLHFAIWQALYTVRALPCAVALQEKARALQPFFPENRQPAIVAKLRRFHYDRHTARYEPVLSLAWLLLTHLAPLAQAGDHPSLAFMVDMNRLYETYIYRKLKAASSTKGYTLQQQVSAPFWKNRSLRPDMVLHTPSEVMVLDTKWKTLGGNQPPEEDLRQLYVYNHYFQAQRGILLYPKVHEHQTSYRSAYHQPAKDPLFCEVLFVPVMHADKTLNCSVGEDILRIIGR